MGFGYLPKSGGGGPAVSSDFGLIDSGFPSSLGPKVIMSLDAGIFYRQESEGLIVLSEDSFEFAPPGTDGVTAIYDDVTDGGTGQFYSADEWRAKFPDGNGTPMGYSDEEFRVLSVLSSGLGAITAVVKLYSQAALAAHPDEFEIVAKVTQRTNFDNLPVPDRLLDCFVEVVVVMEVSGFGTISIGLPSMSPPDRPLNGRLQSLGIFNTAVVQEYVDNFIAYIAVAIPDAVVEPDWYVGGYIDLFSVNLGAPADTPNYYTFFMEHYGVEPGSLPEQFTRVMMGQLAEPPQQLS